MSQALTAGPNKAPNLHCASADNTLDMHTVPALYRAELPASFPACHISIQGPDTSLLWLVWPEKGSKPVGVSKRDPVALDLDSLTWELASGPLSLCLLKQTAKLSMPTPSLCLPLGFCCIEGWDNEEGNSS